MGHQSKAKIVRNRMICKWNTPNEKELSYQFLKLTQSASRLPSASHFSVEWRRIVQISFQNTKLGITSNFLASTSCRRWTKSYKNQEANPVPPYTGSAANFSNWSKSYSISCAFQLFPMSTHRPLSTFIHRIRRGLIRELRRMKWKFQTAWNDMQIKSNENCSKKWKVDCGGGVGRWRRRCWVSDWGRWRGNAVKDETGGRKQVFGSAAKGQSAAEKP